MVETEKRSCHLGIISSMKVLPTIFLLVITLFVVVPVGAEENLSSPEGLSEDPKYRKSIEQLETEVERKRLEMLLEMMNQMQESGNLLLDLP